MGYGWLTSRHVEPGDPAWPDPDDPATVAADDSGHLNPNHPAVQSYLELIRAEGRRPYSGPVDDPDELRKRMQPGWRPEPRREA